MAKGLFEVFFNGSHISHATYSHSLISIPASVTSDTRYKNISCDDLILVITLLNVIIITTIVVNGVPQPS